MAFQETDGDHFFGREKQITALLEKLRRLYETESTIRILPIYGPSGSGKSSLARAGLIPELARRPIPGYDRARVAVLVPGTHPLESLATVLARIVTQDLTPVAKTREFAGELKQVNEAGEFDGLRRIAGVMPEIAIEPLVVLVDQFEEVYTLCKDDVEREAFVGNLLNAAGDRAKRVMVILTLRSDFLGETQKHAVLNRLFSEQGYLVPAMTVKELRQAIAKPAELAKHPLDSATIDLLVKDTEGREGALPLLQFALTRIWEGLAEGNEPAETLKDIGGVGGALAGEAQRIYQQLSTEEQDIARRIFVSLVQLGEGTKDTRRRALTDSLVSHRNQPEQVKRVIQLFSAPAVRLITLSAAGTTEMAEVTHEALFEHWQQLQSWLESSRSDIRFQRRLDEAAQYWQGQRRPEGSLWRPPDLDLLKQYKQRAGDDMTPLQVEFFSTSKHVENRYKQLRWLGVGGLVTGLVVTTGLATFAIHQLQQAQQQRVDQLAAIAEASISTNPTDAAIHAIAAVGLGQSVLFRSSNYSSPTSDPRNLLHLVQTNKERNQLLHETTVWTVAFSSDGKTIASGSRDGLVRLWDANTGKPIGQPLHGHKDDISSVAFSPDGKMLVSGSEDTTIQIWDVTTGNPIGQSLRGHKEKVWAVAFSRDGKLIASASRDKTIQLWDVRTGRPIGQPLRGHIEDVWAVAFSPDGNSLVSGSQDNSLRLWDVRTGKPIGQPLRGHTDDVRSVAFSPDGKRIVSGSYDRTIRIWETNTEKYVEQSLQKSKRQLNLLASTPKRRIARGSRKRTRRLKNAIKPLVLRGHEAEVRSVVISPDGKTIASGSWDRTIRLWDAKTGRPIGQPLRGHKAEIWAVAFSSNNRTVISGSGDKTVRLWDIGTDSPIGQPLRQHKTEVRSVAFNSDGRIIVSGGEDKTVRLWDSSIGKPIGEPLQGLNAVWAVAFSPINSKMVVSGGRGGNLRLWDVSTGTSNELLLPEDRYDIYSVAFSPNGKLIATGSGGEDHAVRIWDASTRKLMGQPLSGHKLVVSSVAFSSDGAMVASGGGDNTVRLWDVSTLKPIGLPLFGHTAKVRAVAFSPDRKMIASGSEDKTIRLWNVSTGKPIGEPLLGHEDEVRSVAFSSDNTMIVSGSWDRTVRLWDVSTGKQIGEPLQGHQSGISSVAFSPDSKMVASGSSDKTLRLWLVSWERLLQTTCEQLRYHSSLAEPKTDVARKAKQTCDRYVWSKERNNSQP